MLLLFVLNLLVAASVFVVMYFIKHDKDEKEPILPLIFVPIGFGLLAIFISLLAITPGGDPATYAERGVTIPIMFLSALIVGLVEEAGKFWPAALFLKKKPYFDEYTDGIIYFGFIGLFFGTLEDIGYTLLLGGASVGIARLIMGVYFHAALTALIGYYFIAAKKQGKSLKKVFLAFLLVALVHTVYNFCLFTGAALMILFAFVIGLVLNVSLFVYFKKAYDLDKHERAQRKATPTPPTPTQPAHTQAAATHPGHAPNNFCPKCGTPNVHHQPYCSVCSYKFV